HFSLLPRHRGAAPVQWALIEGDDETGVTIMRMDEGMDTGNIVTTVREPILPGDTTGSLSKRLSIKGAPLLVDVIDRRDGDFRGVAQDGSQATYAPKLRSTDAKLDWTLDADAIERKVRAFDPRPGAWGILDGKRLKFWEVAVGNDDPQIPPGSLVVEREVMKISTGSNSIECRVVQPEGGSRMSAAEFLRGHRPSTPAKFS
ncbi:MAG TPA: methionyl-tRNA formyltransferase, partial [Actinomycetota bacterium]|nr:methionyl-tRNA formyltransferase [Actinomycetota bacterium]